jgi:hypothetical protein
MGNPLIGMVFGLAAIKFAVFSIATRRPATRCSITG